MVTLTIGDTSCIMYHGVKLYVWKESWVWDSVVNNTMTYLNCRINTKPFDTTGCWAPNVVVASSQLIYNGQIAHQPQAVVIDTPKTPYILWYEYYSERTYN